LDVEEVRFGEHEPIGRYADLILEQDPRDGNYLRVTFRQHDGDWMPYSLWRTNLPGAAFPRLERKLSVPLPRTGDGRAPVAAVLASGPGLVSEEQAAVLAEDLRLALGEDEGPVVVHAHPDLSWKGLIRLVDVCLAAGAEEVRFAAPTESPPGPGVAILGPDDLPPEGVIGVEPP
jgi:hypothetical protein